MQALCEALTQLRFITNKKIGKDRSEKLHPILELRYPDKSAL